jgi:hypothetical protein
MLAIDPVTGSGSWVYAVAPAAYFDNLTGALPLLNLVPASYGTNSGDYNWAGSAVFVPTDTVQFTRIQFKGMSDGTLTNQANAIRCRIFSDAAGLPDTVLATALATVDGPATTLTAFDLSFTFDSIQLTSGTRYHFVLDIPAGVASAWYYIQGIAAIGGDMAVGFCYLPNNASTLPGDTWLPGDAGYDVAFIITATII